MTKRPPAVAGSFYPADPAALTQLVDGLLDAADPPAAPFPVTALIAPHAGYAYSGPVAASAFRHLRDTPAKPWRVVVIGPAHYVAFRGIAVPSHGSFLTPLGEVPLDLEAVTSLARLPFVATADPPHAPEHAIEVELPFLQRALRDLTLVPLLVGEATPADVQLVLERLHEPGTAIVVSSDLSHYHDHATATRLDAATAARIEAFAGDALGPQDACGWLAVAGLLRLAQRHRLGIKRLDLRNSGDVAGGHDRVVGYGAWILG